VAPTGKNFKALPTMLLSTCSATNPAHERYQAVLRKALASNSPAEVRAITAG